MAGLLWQSSVLIVKVFDAGGNGSSATLLEGTRFAISEAQRLNKRLVINYSGGGPASTVKKTAVDEAARAGALLVAAAGNADGSPVDFPAAYTTSYAGTSDHVIAVAASDSASNPAIFSNAGPELSVLPLALIFCRPCRITPSRSR